MRKILFIWVACWMACATSLKAEEKEIQLRASDIETVGHRNEIPTVRYDESQVTLSVDTVLTDVKVEVVDENGKRMGLWHLALVADVPVTLSLPSSSKSEKWLMKVVVDGRVYYGYFEP